MNSISFIKLIEKYQQTLHIIGRYADDFGYGFGFLTLNGTIKVDVTTMLGEFVSIHLDNWNNQDEITFSLDWTAKKGCQVYGPDFAAAQKLIDYAKTLR